MQVVCGENQLQLLHCSSSTSNCKFAAPVTAFHTRMWTKGTLTNPVDVYRNLSTPNISGVVDAMQNLNECQTDLL